MDSNQWQHQQRAVESLIEHYKQRAAKHETKTVTQYDANFLSMMKIVPDLSPK